MILMVSLALASAVQAGELYRWVDANGNVSFSDRPQHDVPKQVVNREDIRRAKAAARAAERERRAEAEAREIARLEREYAARDSSGSAATVASCAEARETLKTYRSAGLLYTDSASGGYRVMRHQERQALVEELARDIAAYCS